jgi:sporulation protein YlmC with PRC-barrel domain
MRKNIDSMLGFSIMAIDGELGKVRDFYFDDETWTIRYMVVQTGSWLLGRKVLISFASVKKINYELSSFLVDLNCEQVKNSPDIDIEKPVFRQHEMELHEHYMLPAYWTNTPGITWGIDNYPIMQEPATEQKNEKDEDAPVPTENNQHLRSARQIEGYLIHTVDGEIGHIKDFLVDLEKWCIVSLIVDTRNLLAGRKILLSPDKVERIEWEDSEVYVNVSRGFIIESPEFDLEKDL